MKAKERGHAVMLLSCLPQVLFNWSSVGFMCLVCGKLNDTLPVQNHIRQNIVHACVCSSGDSVLMQTSGWLDSSSASGVHERISCKELCHCYDA